MEQLYHLLDAFFAPGILLGMAVCLFFLHIPPKGALRNYRLARIVMGTAYLFYAVCIYVEYYVVGHDTNDALARPTILVVACFQAFLFSNTLITLIRINYLSRRQLIIEVLLISAVLLGLVVTHLYYGDVVARWAFWGATLFYVCLLLRYVLLFNREYINYENQMSEYFSDGESHRLLWVKRSFYISLAVGVLALVYALVPIATIGTAFMMIVIVFYMAFGVRFINYALQFQSLEPAITETDEALAEDTSESHLKLMDRIDALMKDDKLYCRPDLSVADIATRLGERARMVSTVISICRQVNFKTYINEYRVLEAKRLLDEDQDNARTIDAIACEAGFANRSSFYRVFKRSQNISPTDYRLTPDQAKNRPATEG